jgi:hypothetical protein
MWEQGGRQKGAVGRAGASCGGGPHGAPPAETAGDGGAMRIGAVYEWKQNVHYRTLNPLEALRRRGHEVAYAREGTGHRARALVPERLSGCEVVHGYRMLGPEELRIVQSLIRRGAAFVWDTDDDLGSLPIERSGLRELAGASPRRLFAQTLGIARLADVVVASTEPLAERYRAAGIARVEVLGNYLAPAALHVRRRRHAGVVVGWTAGLEHAADVARIPVAAALRGLLDAHPHVRVESLGLDLALAHERYAHCAEVPFARLQDHVARWDLALAPLADIPFNRARSDVKLKEYASVGVPWLASPVGPYAGYGAAEGGRLVSDDGWGEALAALVGSGLARRRLGWAGRRWARQQTIDRVAGRWEAVLAEAIERRRARLSGRDRAPRSSARTGRGSNPSRT